MAIDADFVFEEYTDNPDVIRFMKSTVDQIFNKFLSITKMDEIKADFQEELFAIANEMREYTDRKKILKIMMIAKATVDEEVAYNSYDSDRDDSNLQDPYYTYDTIPSNADGAAEGDLALTLLSASHVNVYKLVSGTWQKMTGTTGVPIGDLYCYHNTKDNSGHYFFAGTWNQLDFSADMEQYVTQSELATALNLKQDKLIFSGAGQNIKTVDNFSLEGTGNIATSGGVGSPASFFGVIFGNAQDVANGFATLEFSDANFEMALETDSVTKIGFYGADGTQSYTLSAPSDAVLTSEKLLLSTNGKATLTCQGATIFNGENYHNLGYVIVLNMLLGKPMTTKADDRANIINRDNIVSYDYVKTYETEEQAILGTDEDKRQLGVVNESEGT